MRNQVQLTGHLGSDPQVVNIQNGKSKLVKINLATNENFKDSSGEWATRTDWHHVEAWGTLAERMEKNLKKGANVVITGRLRSDSYEDKDGNKRTKVYVRADEFALLKQMVNSGSEATVEAQKETVG